MLRGLIEALTYLFMFGYFVRLSPFVWFDWHPSKW
jgi:hypothetical protein